MSDKIRMIRQLREDTGMGLYEVKKAVEESGYDYDKAYALLMSRGTNRIRQNRESTAGRVETYNHGGRIGVVLEVNCETDFTARTDDFITLCHEIAMQIAATNPTDVNTLLASDYVREPGKMIEDLVQAVAIACGENVIVSRFARFELGGLEEQMAPLITPTPYKPDLVELAIPQELPDADDLNPYENTSFSR